VSPDETAKQVLDQELMPTTMKFSAFRQRMTDEHPEFLTDDEIHDLYMRHVVNRPRPGSGGGGGGAVSMPPPTMTLPENDSERIQRLVNDVVRSEDAKRATPQEVRAVAERKSVRLSKQSRKRSRRGKWRNPFSHHV
jgi:hypothetical protein